KLRNNVGKLIHRFGWNEEIARTTDRLEKRHALSGKSKPIRTYKRDCILGNFKLDPCHNRLNIICGCRKSNSVYSCKKIFFRKSQKRLFAIYCSYRREVIGWNYIEFSRVI